MKVSVKDSAPCEKLLSVNVSEDWIQKEYEDFFQKIAKDARVPGFRPGKAPQEVVRTKYREEARETVLERLITRSFREAVGEKQLEFLGRPTIRDVEFTDQKLSYEALVEIAPAIKLGKYKGLAVERPVPVIKPEEMDQAVDRVRESLAKYEAVENRTAQMGDFVIADYHCFVDGKEVDQRSDDWFELREDEFLKGFSAQLVGVKAGEAREIKITFPEKFGRKEWASKEGTFKVHIKELKQKKLLPADDELARETGEFETLADLRKHLESQIQSQKSKQAEVEFENKIFEALLKENNFSVPKGVVERRLVHLTQSTLESLARQGMPQEALEKEAKAFYEKLRPEAERQVRLSFLLEEIGKKENLQLSDADFEAKYKETAARHRQPEEAVRKYYTEHPEAKESLGIQILNEKVIQLVKDNTKHG